MSLAVRLATSFAEVEPVASAADRLGFPFFDPIFLRLLEETGCVSAARGWQPAHLVVEEGGEPIAFAPAYVKAHSEGEFVFDWAWADAHARYGLPYYPKLLLAVPFTPATGPRVLAMPGVDRARAVGAVARALPEIARELGFGGVHVNFVREDEVAAFGAKGFLERHGLQLHWHRRGARSIDDFLARFDSKRRNQWKRERRRVQDAGITWRRLDHAELTDDAMRFVHRCYRSTVDAHVYGRPYLNEAFFVALARSPFRERLVVLVAERAGERLAMTFNVRGDGVLYGRYWGALEPVPYLHFVLGYEALVETAIALGIDTIEPGAGGDHKQARGFDPTRTRSVHWIADPRLGRAIEAHVARERAAVAQEAEELGLQGPWARDAVRPASDAAHTGTADTFVTDRDVE